MGAEAPTPAGLPAPVTTGRTDLPSSVIYERVDRTLVSTLYGHVTRIHDQSLAEDRFLVIVQEKVLGVTKAGEEVTHWLFAHVSPADTEEEARVALRDYMDSLMLA